MGGDTSLGAVGGGRFPSTNWDLLQKLHGGTEQDRRRLLDELLSVYWRPVFAFVRRSWGKSVEDAKDLTQEFLVRLIEGDFFEFLDSSRGSLRGYLRRSLDHFLIDTRRRDRAQKRRPSSAAGDAAGSPRLLSLDAIEVGLADRLVATREETPEQAFDRNWDRTVLSETVRLLREHMLEAGKSVQFECFQIYCLEGAGWDGPGSAEALVESAPHEARPQTYKEIAERLGLSVHDVHNHLKFCRGKMERFLTEVISSYTTDPSQAAQERARLIGA